MITILKNTAEEVGINLFITNSKEKIEVQLNRLTREEDLPIMLVSWDIDVALTFSNGFLNNPTLNITSLLLTKPETLEKGEAEDSADEMALLFQKMIQLLNNNLVIINKSIGDPIINAGYKMVPIHGHSKHAGVLGRFTMIGPITKDC